MEEETEGGGEGAAMTGGEGAVECARSFSMCLVGMYEVEGRRGVDLCVLCV